MHEIIAHYTEAKSSEGPNEDRLAVTESFVAVVDGATAKAPYSVEEFGNSTPGAVAARLIAETVEGLPPGASEREAVDAFTESLSGWRDLAAPPTASVTVYSSARREIWVVGSAMVRVDGRNYAFEPLHEKYAAGTRASYLMSLLSQGHDPDELRRTDPGRELILPLLRNEKALRNVDTGAPWHFGGIDGRHVPDRFLSCVRVSAGARVTLASDGYPELFGTFEQTEENLAHVLAADPLMVGAYPKTKPLRPGAGSFDDRTYVQFLVR